MASAITIILGWWGIIGFFWTLEALVKNLVGGPKFPEQNARLLAYRWEFAISPGRRSPGAHDCLPRDEYGCAPQEDARCRGQGPS
jgi:hypothetical protein